MSNEGDKALVPVEQRSIDFYGDVITAVMVEVDGRSAPLSRATIRTRTISEADYA